MHRTTWDYLTFAVFFVIAAGGVGLAVLVLGLPGRIAIAWKNPDIVFPNRWLNSPPRVQKIDMLFESTTRCTTFQDKQPRVLPR